MTTAELPSFREQYAVVYDDYMDTLGGGERSALAYAKALVDLGFYTEILSMRPVPAREKIEEVFGDEFAGIAVRQVASQNLYNYLRSSELMVFVNHTHMSFMPNPARIGIYSQMFPNYPMSRFSHPKEMEALSTYQIMLNNSSFTKTYADGYLEYPTEQSLVLTPPIGQNFVDLAHGLLERGVNKEKRVVHIGRFNPGNHNKNQKIIIQAFLEAKRHNPKLADWKLILIGNVNPTPESEAYFQECRRLIQDDPSGSIHILENLPQRRLIEELERAFAYIHGTGAFLPPGEKPQQCEHFGLSIIEAMAFGAIPIVYARGGIFDVIDPGVSGLPYIDFEGMVTAISDVVELWGSTDAGAFQAAVLKASLDQGQRTFSERLGRYIGEVLQQ